MALTEEQSLRQALACEEENLTTLEQKQQKSRERLATLRAELTAITSAISIPSASATQPSADIPTTPKEKVSLFRSLFRGRNDVYPLLWVSSKTGRLPGNNNEDLSGYSLQDSGHNDSRGIVLELGFENSYWKFA